MSVTSTENFSALMDAVTKAYGKDVWNGITSAKDFYSADFASKITQVEGVSATYLKNGKVAYYTYADDVIGAASSASNVINSNTGLATVAQKVNVPSTVTVDTTGRVIAESGMKTVSTGTKIASVMGKVATGVAAVGAGVQLGATIDSLLYNANPDFWDSNGMSTLNPQTWDSLVSSEQGKDIFNMVFGIDKDTGETQPYLDEKAFAYIAQYLVSQGAFDSGYINTNGVPGVTPSDYTYNLSRLETNTAIIDNVNYTTSGSSPIYFTNSNFGSNVGTEYINHQPIFVSTEPFTITKTGGSSPETFNSESVRYNNVTYYIYRGSIWQRSYTQNVNPDIISYVLLSNSTPITTSGTITNYIRIFTYSLLFGIFSEITGVDGIDKQDGAIIPTGITDSMTIDEVIDQLKTLYPDLWDNAITHDVIQPDGTTNQVVYVPTAIPDNIIVNDDGDMIVTGGADSLQGDTAINDNSTDNLIESLLKILYDTDPYNPQPPAEDVPENYPDTGDGITPPYVPPTGSASALYSIYNPSQAQLNDFGTWLWSSNFVDQLLKIFNDPMQAIIGLHKVFAAPIISGSGSIKVGYLDSGVSANLVSDQYTTIDCGSIDLLEYFTNVLDYTETDIYLYLPFIGIVHLNTADVMRGKINVTYKVDILTGACLCSVNVTRDLSGGQLYTYSGNCAVQYPLSSGSYMGIVSSLLGVAGSVVGTIASGGAMLPLALGAGASTINSMKTNVEHSGNISGNAGAMGIKKPYLIIRRPQTAIANSFNIYDGYAENRTVNISDCKGFVKVRSINLNGIPEATENEAAEIKRILQEGILI